MADLLPTDRRLKWVSLAALVGQNCAAVLLIRITQRGIGDEVPRYNATAVVWITEFVKFFFCLVFAFRGNPSVVELYAELQRDFWPLVVPAGLFALQNNLLFIALNNLEATLFQVTYQLKLVFTALLMVLMLNTKLSLWKWISLAILVAGIVLTQLSAAKKTTSPPRIGGDDDSSLTTKNATTEDAHLLIGLVAVIVSATSSAFASVYFEKVLKGSATSLWMRNIQLAMFSILINGVVFLKDNSIHQVFLGFFPSTWVLVGVQALGGIVVAMVMKYADNILKGFATSLAIVLSGLFSWWYLNFQPTWLFTLGAVLVLGATYLYSATA